jgi:para-aminobenzoate synthetase/4-amino-4-deoxychorismate lyase
MQTLIDFSNADSDPARAAPLRCAFGVPRQTLVALELAQVRPILEAVDALSKQGYWCVGYVSYEAGAAFDPAFEVHESFGPLVWFGVHDAPLAWPETEPGDEAHVQWHEGLTRPAFDEGMHAIHQAIAAGELYQLNYTAQMRGQLDEGTPIELFMALRRAQPDGYAAYIDTGEAQVLSVSPELFFDWDGERILTRPMKGTAPRGTTPEGDAALAAQLQASPKERAENVMIVDLIRNDLSRVALPFSVRVPHLFQLQALPSVWQMTSDVEALTRPQNDTGRCVRCAVSVWFHHGCPQGECHADDSPHRAWTAWGLLWCRGRCSAGWGCHLQCGHSNCHCAGRVCTLRHWQWHHC